MQPDRKRLVEGSKKNLELVGMMKTHGWETVMIIEDEINITKTNITGK